VRPPLPPNGVSSILLSRSPREVVSPPENRPFGARKKKALPVYARAEAVCAYFATDGTPPERRISAAG
ncbi:MAG TPA: hypothetical protein VJ386_02430, partial [Candidatus Deferrimicrobiaceae bacterium]|nr:hypothetical protein [Candidatus Deferrimicrobiaceae bacterium]